MNGHYALVALAPVLTGQQWAPKLTWTTWRPYRDSNSDLLVFRTAASHYTDWAIPDPKGRKPNHKKKFLSSGTRRRVVKRKSNDVSEEKSPPSSELKSKKKKTAPLTPFVGRCGPRASLTLWNKEQSCPLPGIEPRPCIPPVYQLSFFRYRI
jgi:hypothetical protein